MPRWLARAKGVAIHQRASEPHQLALLPSGHLIPYPAPHKASTPHMPAQAPGRCGITQKAQRDQAPTTCTEPSLRTKTSRARSQHVPTTPRSVCFETPSLGVNAPLTPPRLCRSTVTPNLASRLVAPLRAPVNTTTDDDTCGGLSLPSPPPAVCDGRLAPARPPAASHHTRSSVPNPIRAAAAASSWCSPPTTSPPTVPARSSRHPQRVQFVPAQEPASRHRNARSLARSRDRRSPSCCFQRRSLPPCLLPSAAHAKM